MHEPFLFLSIQGLGTNQICTVSVSVPACVDAVADACTLPAMPLPFAASREELATAAASCEKRPISC